MKNILQKIQAIQCDTHLPGATEGKGQDYHQVARDVKQPARVEGYKYKCHLMLLCDLQELAAAERKKPTD
jgi:hypothetical protein